MNFESQLRGILKIQRKTWVQAARPLTDNSYENIFKKKLSVSDRNSEQKHIVSHNS